MRVQWHVCVAFAVLWSLGYVCQGSRTATNVTSQSLSLDWHEQCGPTLIPSPRNEDPWLRFSAKLSDEVQQAERSEGYELVFFGDSISEHWRGTSVGQPDVIGPAVHDVFVKYFGKYRANVLAIAGDEIAQLHWRLLHGQLPTVHPPKAAVVLIGTNDLAFAGACGKGEAGMVAAADGVVDRLAALLGLIRASTPETDIILMALLPRSTDQTGSWPSPFTKAMSIINDRMEGIGRSDDHIHFVNCNAAYLLAEGGFDLKLIPDGVHPNADGMALMADCLTPLIQRFVDSKAAS